MAQGAWSYINGILNGRLPIEKATTAMFTREVLREQVRLYCTARASGQFLIEWSKKQNAGIAGFFKSSLGAGFSQNERNGYKMRS